LRIWDYGSDSGDLFSCVVFVPVGSRLESEGQGGISHLVEHCLFRGTQRRPWREVRDLLERAVTYNGMTHRDYTSFVFSCAPKDAITLLDLFGEMISRPAFDADDIQKEQKIVYEELMGRTFHRGAKLRTFESFLYPGYPIARPVGGDPGAVSRFAAHEVREHYRQHYLAGDIIIGVQGLADRVMVHETIERSFSGLRPGRHDRLQAEIPAPRGGNIFTGAIPEGPGAQFITGYHVAERTPDNLVSLWILEELIGADFYLKVREERGLSYSPQVEAVTLQDAWRLELRAEVSNDRNITEINQLVAEIVSRIPHSSLEALASARLRVTGALQPGDVYSLQRAVHKAWLMENSGGSSADLVAQVRSLSEATLSRFAETLNDESRYWLADDRAMGASANTPTLAVLLVLACGLLLVDGFHRFHVTRSVLRFPSRCVRGGARRAGVRIERYRGRVRRHADIDQLEAEIQEWLAQQKPL